MNLMSKYEYNTARVPTNLLTLNPSALDQPGSDSSSYSSHEQVTQSLNPEPDSPSSKSSPAGATARTRAEVATDLEEWQKRFATAANKGAEDLGERVGGIVNDYITGGALGQGANLALELEDVVGNQLSNVKSLINNSVASLPPEDASSDEEKAEDEINKGIKEAATFIRDHTHALRKWRNSFDEDLSVRVSAAINSSLHILDSIRDLGFQELGMRWASADGVTYEDWAKYHAIKSELDDWKSGVSVAATQHPKLSQAGASANEVLDHGMAVAEAAAKELPRLRDVGKWKIAAREVNDNFETRTEPPPARVKPDEESHESDELQDDTASASDTATAEAPSETDKVVASDGSEEEPPAPTSTVSSEATASEEQVPNDTPLSEKATD